MSLAKYFFACCALTMAVLLQGCGYNGSGAPSGLSKRVLVSNSNPNLGSSPGLFLIDAQRDLLNKTIGISNGPTKLLTASGMTAVLISGTNQVQFFTNSTETVTATSGLQGIPADIALSTDGQTAYAAVRNVGVVEVLRTSDGAIVGTINVPTVSRLVEGPNEHKLLAFSDGAVDGHTFFVIDTATNTLLPANGISDPSLDQPYSAVFDTSDSGDTTAFILNCGKQCGGTTASVVKVNFSGTPALTAVTGQANAFASSPVAAATVGLLSGSNLFIAGTLPSPLSGACPASMPSCGSLQVIDTGSLAVTSTFPITDGLHQHMAITSSNRLYVGAGGCTTGANANNAVRGCLSIFNTSTSSTIFPPEPVFRQNFDVTGFQPISNRNVLYVTQGGALDIFDINTDAVSTTATPIDIVGTAVGVVQIDP